MSTEGNERLNRAKATADRLLANIETVVHGKTERIKLVLAALACGGHVLFEDVPGTAKTVLARAIAGSIDDAYPSRVQCTPDLQPTDVTGLSVYNQQTRDFEFRPGPVFANILLVDEINRAMPNPLEQDGTVPLPESQLDRFFLRTELGYPTVDEEIGIVREQRAGHPLDDLKPVASLDEVRDGWLQLAARW